MKRFAGIAGLVLAWSAGLAGAQHDDKFRQLDELLPTPNVYRTASGAPGHAYWQQKVDYEIDVALDEENHWVTGSERITYQNNSPDTLPYLWVQLDQNNFEQDSIKNLTRTMRVSRRNPSIDESMSFDRLDAIVTQHEFKGGHRITRVADSDGDPLEHVINGTMMRIELAEPIPPGGATEFAIDWNYPVLDHKHFGARSGRELFDDDGNWVYQIAQWFPRLCVYSDNAGWQNKQFITSEFTLEFGDYVVNITVPDDHVVASSGELQNPEDVLTGAQRERFADARDADSPVFIITPEEAEANETSTPEGTKTWTFKAENVRDFAWASSRKFIWDAQGFHHEDGRVTMAMSFWPKEGEPLWSQYSTHAVLQALETYGRQLFPCPYPVMISVNGPVGGMEYPMITFNGARPEDDGTYGRYTKYGLITVIIHEVGHTWFPMIVNSDERQWTWMDEGTNSFMQFIAEQDWEDEYPSRRGFPRKLVNYFQDSAKVPIMTDGDSLLQVGNNAYGKPAVALNILRETILGRDLFDYAFKTYANRWKFKKPEPADLFRTMEDASGTDLDWFWHGWFYTVDSVDISIESLTHYEKDSGDPEIDKAKDRKEEEDEAPELTRLRNADNVKRVEKHPELFDFYDEYDPHEVTDEDRKKYTELLEELTDREKDLMARNDWWYVAEFVNRGGLVMPLILKIKYTDGTSEIVRYPAEIWRYENDRIEKMLILEKEVASLELDPYQETGDINMTNNVFPREISAKRFKVTPRDDRDKNPMQKQRERDKKAEEADAAEEQNAEGNAPPATP